jgi:glycosyltransferase involved in cell wall biosynthesis
MANEPAELGRRPLAGASPSGRRSPDFSAAYDVIIPARNEAATVAGVVRAARSARGAGTVFVIDDQSDDETATAARAAGAVVLPSNGHANKGAALATGVAASAAEVVVFFDADILDARPEHFEALAGPVVDGRYRMCCGLVDYGRLRSALFVRLPPITGLRAVRREIFEAIAVERRNGFQIEIMINEVIARGGMPSAIRVLPGAGHRSKIEKSGWIDGGGSHLRMTAELLKCFGFVPLWTYWSYLRHLDVLPPAGPLS